MRRWETLVALLAVILASLAAMRVPGQLGFALVAIALIAFVGLSRIRAGMVQRPRHDRFDATERARRIREERNDRFDR
ncbi:MAG: hypothetical protein ACYDGM_05245 [Vulcanimicrobiaceae bacterium]